MTVVNLPIVAVGSLASAQASTLSVNPTSLGDVLVLTILGPGGTPSGGGVATWQQLFTEVYAANTAFSAALWWGVITTTGSGTITSTGADGLAAQQFTAGSGATWAADGSGAGNQAATGTSGNFASVSPSGVSELYLGAAQVSGGNNASGESGFVYTEWYYTSYALFVYSIAARSPNSYAPTWAQSLSDPNATVSALLTATGPLVPLAPVSVGSLVFNDTFAGTSLNTTLWSPYAGGVDGYEIAPTEVNTYAAQVVVDNGLTLNLITDAGASSGYAAGWITTDPDDGVVGHTGFSTTGGYIEGMVLHPATNAAHGDNHPSFWVVTTGYQQGDTPGAPYGEVDLFEVNSGAWNAKVWDINVTQHSTTPSGDWGNTYHVYGVYWNPDLDGGTVIIYWDGVAVNTQTGITLIGPMYIYCEDNLIQGQTYNHTPSSIQVDYIRAWVLPAPGGEPDEVTPVPEPSTIYQARLAVLNQLAGTKGLGENAAANAYAGTKNLGLLAALNAKAGTKNLGLVAVCNKIAGTTGLGYLQALNVKAGNGKP